MARPPKLTPMPPADPSVEPTGSAPASGLPRGDDEAVTGSGAVVVGVGAAARWCSDLVVDLGEGHPSSHGLLRLAVRFGTGDPAAGAAPDGSPKVARILTAEPIVGHLHRGVEKLYEARDYRQILALANRHDWHSSYHGELGVALAVERLLGLEVPERATWLRTLLAEYTRIVHHLAFLDHLPLPGGGPLVGLHELRERLLAVLEAGTGGRMHVMVLRIGGLVADVPAGWFASVAEVMTEVAAALPRIDAALAESRATEALRGVGTITAATACGYGVLGVASRAAGMPLDLRRDDPYLAYGELFGGRGDPTGGAPGRVVTRGEGDGLARMQVLAEQCAVSVDLVLACLDRLRSMAPGPIDVRLPRVLRVPEGSTYVVTEAPAGHAGWLLVSRGEKTPWRLAMRTPSFAAVSALPAVLPGHRLQDLAPVLGSLCFVLGDVDR